MGGELFGKGHTFTMMRSIELTSSTSSAAPPVTSIINAAATTEDPAGNNELAKQAVVSSVEPQTKHDDSTHQYGNIYQDQIAANLATLMPSAQQPSRRNYPDIGVLGEFKSGEQLSVIKQRNLYAKHPVTAGPDVGILKKRLSGKQQRTRIANAVHAKNRVLRRSLENFFVPMCPGEKGNPGWRYFNRLFNDPDLFPNCSCPSPVTCGPSLCQCLDDADGNILMCMDSFNALCAGTYYLNDDGNASEGSWWSMEMCMGDSALLYCYMLPCFVNEGSFWPCLCNTFDSFCDESKVSFSCAVSKCCQAQTDDEGRLKCIYEGYKDYYEENTSSSVFISIEDMLSSFNDCSFKAGGYKSIAECFCDIISYRECANYGAFFPNFCESWACCKDQTDDVGRLNCFSRYRQELAGWHLVNNYDPIQQSCASNGRSTYQCTCDIQGLTNCVFGSCELFQCCQAQMYDEGMKECIANRTSFVPSVSLIPETELTTATVSPVANICDLFLSTNLVSFQSALSRKSYQDNQLSEELGSDFTNSLPVNTSSAPLARFKTLVATAVICWLSLN